MADAVHIEVADHVATITLDRPPVNAMDWPMMRELTDVFHSLAGDQSVRAVVLTAAGKLFCAGSDMKARAGVSSEAAYNQSIRSMLDAITDCDVPVVAAVNGHAL